MSPVYSYTVGFTTSTYVAPRGYLSTQPGKVQNLEVYGTGESVVSGKMWYQEKSTTKKCGTQKSAGPRKVQYLEKCSTQKSAVPRKVQNQENAKNGTVLNMKKKTRTVLNMKKKLEQCGTWKCSVPGEEQ